jgi:hypothetical protein
MSNPSSSNPSFATRGEKKTPEGTSDQIRMKKEFGRSHGRFFSVLAGV